MEEKLDEIHKLIKDLYPEAVGVNIFVNADGIEAKPVYKTNTNGYSMKTISNKWIRKV